MLKQLAKRSHAVFLQKAIRNTLPKLMANQTRPVGVRSFNQRATFLTSVPTRSFGLVAVKLPDLGEGTKEATIKEWYVKPGTKVEEFDDLVEVFTDKLVAKIPSTCTGIVKEVNFEVDDVCAVGHQLLMIETEGDAPAEQ